MHRSDLQERYEPYCADFGPVNLGVVYRFCEMMDERITDPRLASRHLVYYTDENPLVRSNTAFLLAAYMVCCHGWTAEQAVVPFAMIEPNPFKVLGLLAFLVKKVQILTQMEEVAAFPRRHLPAL